MIVATIVIKGKIYELNERHVKQMETAGLKTHNVRTRLIDGWLLEDAVRAPKGTRLLEWMEHKEVENTTQAILEKRRQRDKERLRKKKPHLFNVPQKHGRGKWCQHLMEHDIFPKKVVG